MPKPSKIAGPLTQTKLIQTVAAELDISFGQAQAAVHAVTDVITRTVADGNSVTITNFGAWIPKTIPARTARNPQTGGPVHVPEHQVVRFRIAPRLAEVVRGSKTRAGIRKLPKGALSGDRP